MMMKKGSQETHNPVSESQTMGRNPKMGTDAMAMKGKAPNGLAGMTQQDMMNMSRMPHRGKEAMAMPAGTPPNGLGKMAAKYTMDGNDRMPARAEGHMQAAGKNTNRGA